MFIRDGSIGKLTAIISLALLLLDDFFTYMDGGEALLGGFWQTLIDIFNLFTKDSGEAFEKIEKLIKTKAPKILKFLMESAAPTAMPIIQTIIRLSIITISKCPPTIGYTALEILRLRQRLLTKRRR